MAEAAGAAGTAEATGGAFDESTARAQLKAKMPYYMIPSAFVRIESADAIPTSPVSGKVLRQQLPHWTELPRFQPSMCAAAASKTQAGAAVEAGLTATERTLLEAAQRFLHADVRAVMAPCRACASHWRLALAPNGSQTKASGIGSFVCRGGTIGRFQVPLDEMLFDYGFNSVSGVAMVNALRVEHGWTFLRVKAVYVVALEA